MSAVELIEDLTARGVLLWEKEGDLCFRAPRGVMTPERLGSLKDNKRAVLELIRSARAVSIVHDPDGRYEPFPLTDVQAAYLLGRSEAFPFGGVACHGYGELLLRDVDPPRVLAAWRGLVARHDMLRAVVSLDGWQQVRREVPPLDVAVVDERGHGAAFEATAAAAREELGNRMHDPASWPLFEVRLTVGDELAIMHVSIDFLVADFVSIQRLLAEFQLLYAHPDEPLAPLDITYRDYLHAVQGCRDGGRDEVDRAYWMARLGDLPGPPELPLTSPGATRAPARFRRLDHALSPERWRTVTARARREGLTPSAVVLSAYAEVVGRWSRRDAFVLNLTMLDRQALHPDVGGLVGDFTSLELLEVRRSDEPFVRRVRHIQERLWEDLEHRQFTGVEVIRELVRERGQAEALFPVVFTSAIGLGDVAASTLEIELGEGISQTPQVWIDCQTSERGGGLAFNWDVREGVLPDGVVEDMFASFVELLDRLAEEPRTWSETCPVGLPPRQVERRRRVADTSGPRPAGRLHAPVFDQARRTPERLALVGARRSLTYGELAGAAQAVAESLRAAGVGPGDIVAVHMDKGWEQVAAVLGIHLVGAAYLPMEASLPAARRNQLLADAGARCAVVQPVPDRPDDWPDAVTRVVVEADAGAGSAAAVATPTTATPDDLAYVIYTSGSTGAPKGVMVAHRAARNTVDDINRRFGLGPDDRVLGLSSLGFDLSVYDIFGPLAVGGCLVLPDPGRSADPSHWAQLVAEHGVTVWNSVPAQMHMFQEHLGLGAGQALSTLRLALLSGDWIPVALPDQVRQWLPEVDLVSLGGATEAAVWSIFHPIGEVAPGTRSIPYGRPLTNQRFHVLDPLMHPCPDWTAGELYIAGDGLAEGYLGDARRTAEKFLVHPETGERLYRTGDWGRYLPDGDIEFLGREDAQVKIRGHRIELAEVEAALASHPAVSAAAVVVVGDPPLDRRLAAFVEPHQVESGRTQSSLAAAAAAARFAGDAVVADVDQSAAAAYYRAMDDVAAGAMVTALRERGLFVDGHEHCRPDQVEAAVAPRHRRLLRRWLRALQQRDLLQSEGDALVLARSPAPDEIDRGWDRVEELRAATGDPAELVEFFRTCSARLGTVLAGDEEPLSLLFPDGGFWLSDALYSDALLNRWAGATVAGLVGHDPGGLRVLEVGAGAGGVTAPTLAAMTAIGADFEYTVSDISQFFVTEAQARFGHHPAVRFARLDLDRSGLGQGFAPNSFDVVVAGDVLHATRDPRRSLAHVRELLAPRGRLVMAEMTRDHLQVMTSLELMMPSDPDRDAGAGGPGGDQTFLSAPQWQDALCEAGADDVVALLPDGPLADATGMAVLAARFKADRAVVTGKELADHLRRLLPDYMVPPTLWVVDDLPLTANLKLDRAVLAGWATSSAGPQRSATSPAAGTGLEGRVAELWAEILGVQAVPADVGFYNLGGDSLLASRLAGRLGEELAEARAAYFDELLRVILEGPTVGELAAWLADAASASGSAGDPTGAAPEQECLVRLVGDGRPLRSIVLHDGAGTLAWTADLVPALAEAGAVVGLVVPDPLSQIDQDPGRLIERLADRYLRALPSGGDTPLHLYGRHGAGWLAVELGRRLLEAGAPPPEVTLVDTWPIARDVTDELMVEYLVARELGIAPTGLGYPGEETMAEVLLADAPAGLAGLAATSRSDRLARLADLAPTAAQLRADTVAVRCALFARLLEGERSHQVSPYLGDVTIVTAPDRPRVDAVLRPLDSHCWSTVCLGEVRIVEVPYADITTPALVHAAASSA